MPSPASSTPAERLDSYAHALLARKSGSLSPVSSLLAWQDWAAHLAASPGKQMDLAHLATSQAQALAATLPKKGVVSLLYRRGDWTMRSGLRLGE